MGLRTTIGRVLGGLGVICALIGIFFIEGISIEFPGIILGGLGYYLALTVRDRTGQILGISAMVLSVISMVISGLGGPPR